MNRKIEMSKPETNVIIVSEVSAVAVVAVVAVIRVVKMISSVVVFAAVSAVVRGYASEVRKLMYGCTTFFLYGTKAVQNGYFCTIRPKTEILLISTVISDFYP